MLVRHCCSRYKKGMYVHHSSFRSLYSFFWFRGCLDSRINYCNVDVFNKYRCHIEVVYQLWDQRCKSDGHDTDVRKDRLIIFIVTTLVLVYDVVKHKSNWVGIAEFFLTMDTPSGTFSVALLLLSVFCSTPLVHSSHVHSHKIKKSLRRIHTKTMFIV